MPSLFEMGIIQSFEGLTRKRQRKEKSDLFLLLVLRHWSPPALMLRLTPSAPLGSQTFRRHLNYTTSFPAHRWQVVSLLLIGSVSHWFCSSGDPWLIHCLGSDSSKSQLVRWGPKRKPDLLSPKPVSLASSCPQILLSHRKLLGKGLWQLMGLICIFLPTK